MQISKWHMCLSSYNNGPEEKEETEEEREEEKDDDWEVGRSKRVC